MKISKIGIISLLLGLLIVTFIIYRPQPPALDEGQIAQSFSFDYPVDYHYRQTINDCGPFNVAAVVRILTEENVDSALFAQEIGWRLPNKYTLPWGMEKQLKENELTIETPNLKPFNDKQRLNYLYQTLSHQKPIILLGEREGYEHYITLLGFERTKGEFYAYDSLMPEGDPGLTIDQNGSGPGNRSYDQKDLLDFWRGGGMYGQYQWYALVAAN